MNRYEFVFFGNVWVAVMIRHLDLLHQKQTEGDLVKAYLPLAVHTANKPRTPEPNEVPQILVTESDLVCVNVVENCHLSPGHEGIVVHKERVWTLANGTSWPPVRYSTGYFNFIRFNTKAKLLKGLHAERLLYTPSLSTHMENAFASAWAKVQTHNQILENLVEPLPSKPRPPFKLDESHYILAATLMQWLGSNGGRFMLEEALKEVGAVITYPPKVNRHS